MKKKESITEYDKYSENVVPTRIRFERKIGDLVLLFYVNGYRGVETGEVYYSRDVALTIEDIIKTYYLEKIGIVVTLDIPEVITETPSPTTNRGFLALNTTSTGTQNFTQFAYTGAMA